MARLSALLTCWSCGFPRPRGDGPATGWILHDGYWFSPPTRGWPGGQSRGSRGFSVFPAHAGMARRRWQAWPCPHRFPRPRGDGPNGSKPPASEYWFSPPTRGWPVLNLSIHRHDRVFPAHAGMARRTRLTQQHSVGFPRPRGDGPVIAPNALVAFLFSPPTRGWPAIAAVREPHRGVFPAHAGMARMTASEEMTSGRFPRPRGDGPKGRILILAASPFSPPTRGWPGITRLDMFLRSVFPAHAGMAR